MINPDVCSCCGEIWNREKLKNIPLGKHKLHLCPDCCAEYIKPFETIKTEIKEHADRLKDSLYGDGLRHCLEIIEQHTVIAEPIIKDNYEEVEEESWS